MPGSGYYIMINKLQHFGTILQSWIDIVFVVNADDVIVKTG